MDKKLFRKAINCEIRKDCRKEAMLILELCEDKDREDFLMYHKADKGNICCLVLDFAKIKLVKNNILTQKDDDCFGHELI